MAGLRWPKLMRCTWLAIVPTAYSKAGKPKVQESVLLHRRLPEPWTRHAAERSAMPFAQLQLQHRCQITSFLQIFATWSC